MTRCPVCGYDNRPRAAACEACGEPLPDAPGGAGPGPREDTPEDLFVGEEEDVFVDEGDFVGPAEEGDATGGVIPYKNPQALIAYYLGIMSGFPLVGFPLGIAAFVLGLRGLRVRRDNPRVKGAAHAWVGIGCGGFFTLLWGAVVTLAVVGMIAG